MGQLTLSAVLSGLRRESEGRGFRPLPLISMRAKLLKPYLSASAGMSERCDDTHCARHAGGQETKITCLCNGMLHVYMTPMCSITLVTCGNL